jgi:succinate dehydrogenase / fumarate reductase cytochrome b subunit
MKPLQLLFQSSLGKKYIMAVTGAVLLIYVIGHLIGNLQIFMPRERINAYAHFLHGNRALLWAVRLGLLAVVGLHIWAAIAMAHQNKAARPTGYLGTKAYAASWASRHMFMTGLIIAAFVIYHLLHFTVQVPAINLLSTTDPGKDFTQLLVESGEQKGYRDVHAMLVAGFRQPLITLFYLVGVGLLCVHISHGANSMFQSLGMEEGLWRRRLETSAKVLAVALFVGYASIPLAVFLRLVQ